MTLSIRHDSLLCHGKIGLEYFTLYRKTETLECVCLTAKNRFQRSHLPDLNGAPFKLVRNDEEDEESEIDHGNTRIEELSGRNNISVNCRTGRNQKFSVIKYSDQKM